MRFWPATFLALVIASATAASIWCFNRQAASIPPDQGFALERRAAAALVANHSILFPSRINESELRWSLADQWKSSPQIVLFGSSHGLQVSSVTFGSHQLLNLSVSGAMLVDHLVSTEILAKRQITPRVAVIMVDAWLFNPDVDFETWKARPAETAEMERILRGMAPATFPEVFKSRVDEYIRTRRKVDYSLDPLLRGIDRLAGKALDHVILADGDFQNTRLLPDGSLQPSLDKQSISTEEVRNLALRQFAYDGDRHRYGTYSKVDNGLWGLFDRWVQFLQQRSSRVVFVLSPYHPVIFEKILAQPHSQLRSLEKRIRDLATQRGIAVIGSYDPVRADMTDADFLDGDHLRETGLNRLFSPALPQIIQAL